MRDLTEAEAHSLYTQGVCPFCTSRKFHEGPQGGLATNWYCVICGAGFNLSIPGLGGQLIRDPEPSELPEGWLAVSVADRLQDDPEFHASIEQLAADVKAGKRRRVGSLVERLKRYGR